MLKLLKSLFAKPKRGLLSRELHLVGPNPERADRLSLLAARYDLALWKAMRARNFERIIVVASRRKRIQIALSHEVEILTNFVNQTAARECSCMACTFSRELDAARRAVESKTAAAESAAKPQKDPVTITFRKLSDAEVSALAARLTGRDPQNN